MTATPPPAPDTRPRCGGTPGKPGVMPRRDDLKAHWLCPGCADCQPAPTPSGDDPRPRDLARKHMAVRGSHEERVKAHADLIIADRARSAAALQEAREAASREGRERKVLQEEMVFEQQRAMAAEARLREVEGARDALDASLRSVCGMVALAAQDPSRHLPGELVGLARRTIQSIDAASRPVPAAPCQMCKHDPVDHWEDGRCVRCLSGRCAYTPTPAATPSTDEEGRR